MKGKAAVGAGAAGSARPGGGQGRGGCFAARWVGGAARGRPCAGNAASELHAQPALPRAAPAPAPAPATQDGPGDAAGHRIYPPAGWSGSCLGLYQADRHPGAAAQYTRRVTRQAPPPGRPHRVRQGTRQPV